MQSKNHVVSIVFNKVEGDSRVIKTAQAAINMGYRATIVGVTSAPDIERIEIEGVNVVRIPNYSKHLAGMKLWGEGNKNLQLLIGGFMKTAVSEIVSLQPSIIHSHDMSGIKIGAGARTTLLAGGKDIPWVHDLHEYVAGLTGKLADAYMPICLGWEREYLHKADHLFTVSDALADVVQKSYALPKMPTVTYNTPNSSAFIEDGTHVRAAIGLADDVPLVVFVGRATSLRGCDTIVEAFAKLPDVHLVFVSQGKYIDELTERAKELGMGDRFHTHPYVSSDQVTSFIRSADIGIHGLIHYPNAEVALPNKLFEYLHARLPVVVSDVASMKTFVENNGVGTVFIANDADSCAHAINEAFSRKVEFKSRISNNLLNKYCWEQQERTIQQVYKTLLETPRTKPTAEQRDSAINVEKLDTILFESVLTRALAEASVGKFGHAPQMDIRKNRISRVVSVATKDGIWPAIKIVAASVRRRIFSY